MLKSGFPVHVPGVTINRMCGSSQQAIHFASQAILSGDADLILAGGTEMMSHQPLGADYPAEWPEVGYKLIHQGLSAEKMAKKWKLTREQLDDFAYQSHVKAGQAIDSGYFEEQILPITLADGQRFVVDQGVRRPPNREKMGEL